MAGSTTSVGFVLVSRRGRLSSFGAVRKLHFPSSVRGVGTVAGITSVQGSDGYFVVGRNGSVASIGTAQAIAPIEGLAPIVAVSAGS